MSIETKITNEAEAKKFIDYLDDNGILWHFDDDPYDCGLRWFKQDREVNEDEIKELRLRAEELGDLKDFDEFEYALQTPTYSSRWFKQEKASDTPEELIAELEADLLAEQEALRLRVIKLSSMLKRLEKMRKLLNG